MVSGAAAAAPPQPCFSAPADAERPNAGNSEVQSASCSTFCTHLQPKSDYADFNNWNDLIANNGQKYFIPVTKFTKIRKVY